MSEAGLNDRHSDAASSVVASPSGGPAGAVSCGQCGKVSGASVRFCGGCGARLWEPCAACSTLNAVDLRYCGGCGVSLDEALIAAREHAEGVIEQAARQAEQGRFVDAVRMLNGVELVDHTALEPLRQTIAANLDDCAARREQIVSTAGEVLAEAKRLAAEGKPREALEVAKRVPPALRGLELRTLCDELDQQSAERDRLRKIVKQGIAEKDYDGVYASVQRLLEIDPGDAKIAALAKKLEAKRAKSDRSDARRRLKSALAALKKCDYRAANTLLSSAPDGDFDEKTRRALTGAKERVWLAMQLARAPFADQALLDVADRLAKLQPHDEKAAQLRGKVMRRWKDGLRTHPGRPVAWSKSSVPEGGSEIRPATVPEPLAELCAKKGLDAGQLLVAYGLALQSAGEVEAPIDLAPKRRGWAGRLSLGRSRKRGAAEAWGVDIGSHSVKAIRLVTPEGQDKPVIDKVCVEPIDARGRADASAPGQAEGGLPTGAAAAVGKLMADHDFTGAAVTLGLNSTLTLGRFFRLPWLSDSKFLEAVRYEARARIPLDPEDVLFDHTATEVRDDDSEDEDLDAKVMRVALVAAARSHVEQRAALFAESGAASVAVTSDGVALASAHAAAAPAEDAGPVALVDLGAKTATVVVAFDQGCWFRGSYFGGDVFDQAMVRRFKCGWRTAEEMRRKPSKTAWMHEVDETLQPAFEQGAELVERMLTQFRNEEGQRVTRVRVSGGAALQFGLMGRLRSGN